ncbi:MAG: hypothetical protein AAGG48_27975 [Planctomycetota bacterium]
MLAGCARDEAEELAVESSEIASPVAQSGAQQAFHQQSADQKASGEETGLRSLLVQGPELHDSIRTQSIASIRDLPDGMTFPNNPRHSTERAFIEATAGGGSQGRLDGAGMRAALYARYVCGESEIGFYGLEAESAAVADRREAELRKIWAYGGSLDRARVFRQGMITVVVWLRTDEPTPEGWRAVKEWVEQRLDRNVRP